VRAVTFAAGEPWAWRATAHAPALRGGGRPAAGVPAPHPRRADGARGGEPAAGTRARAARAADAHGVPPAGDQRGDGRARARARPRRAGGAAQLAVRGCLRHRPAETASAAAATSPGRCARSPRRPPRAAPASRPALRRCRRSPSTRTARRSGCARRRSFFVAAALARGGAQQWSVERRAGPVLAGFAGRHGARAGRTGPPRRS
jgi:hypothetical protein